MRRCQARYKPAYDRQVRKTPSFQADSYVFVDKPPFAANSEASATVRASTTYNKPQQPTSGLYHYLKVGTNTVTIDEYGVANKVSNEHVTHAPNANNKHRHDKTMHEAKQTTNKKYTQKKLGRPAPHKGINIDKYVVDKIIPNIGQCRIIKYIVPRYGNEPTENTNELADHIQQQFISKYWQYLSKQRNGHFISISRGYKYKF